VRVAVIGGGIAGLAAAWELRDTADVTVLEPSRLGGCLHTSEFEGHLVDEGPDAFLTRVPEAVQLCRELGLEEELVAPSAGRSLLWWQGRLRPLPDGLVLGVPRQMGSLARSGILSPRGLARAALDLVLPRGRPPATLTVRELVAGRFGTEVADRLVDPLVGGIHAGWTGQLGAAEVVPQLVAAAERSRSLLRGLRTVPASSGDQPIFLTPRLGMSRLVDVLVQALQARGTEFVGTRVASIGTGPDGRVVVAAEHDPFDAAVVATRGDVAAGIIGAEVQDLAALPVASVALVTVALRGASLPSGVNGFLVPRGSGHLMTACSFASNKWPHWADPGQAVVRISAGRHGDQGALELSDAVLTERLLGELGQALGADLTPSASRVSRWPAAFPQYLPGHGEHISRIEAALSRRFPTVTLAGAAYRGSGIPACIGSGRRAAQIAVARAQGVVV
jgi:protoporphyrinogen/coproporphyrinogen III oxidase